MFRSPLAARLVVAFALAVIAAPAGAQVLFAVSVASNEVYRYQVPTAGSPTLDLTLTANLVNPGYVAISPTGELFVSNRHTAGGTAGSVARFLNPTGTPVPNGVIADNPGQPGFDLNNPHGVEFRGGELFVVNSAGDNVLRFTFDAGGQAVSNGTISGNLVGTNARGIGFNAAGDLFVSEANLASQQLNQWTFDAGGTAAFLREFSSQGTNDHGIAFAPWGEMFVASANSNSVSRILFDAGGNPVANGQITGNGLNGPLDAIFLPSGELFVANGGGGVSRFLFDASLNAVPNGTFSTPQGVGGLAFTPAPEPSGLLLAALGLTAGAMGRRFRHTPRGRRGGPPARG